MKSTDWKEYIKINYYANTVRCAWKAILVKIISNGRISKCKVICKYSDMK